ncbi:MAG: Flp pilus assembly protein CpaB [Chloroflexi bacterium]|nr:Flp pilus assembly protein CpaB [Chloroflexota bacterium]
MQVARKKKPQPVSAEFDLGPSIAETRTRSRKLIVAGLVLAVASGLGSFVFLSRAQQQASSSAAPTVPVVVASRTITARTPISADDLQLRNVPMDATNAQGTFQSPDQIVGRISSVAILQGQLVTSNLFAFSAETGAVSIIGPEESFGPDSPAWRAVSLAVPDDRAVGGILDAGQHVDVMVTTTILVPNEVLEEGQFYGDKATKVTYQDVPILTKKGSFYVIKVTEEVAEEIAHMQASGVASFTLALRPEVDNRLVDASLLGQTTHRIIQRYGLSVPQVYPRAGQPINAGPPITAPTPPPAILAAATPAPSPQTATTP